MADSRLFFLPFRPALDANGVIVPGARLFFYVSGTSVPQAPFSDAALTIPLENPVAANAAGVWPQIYLDPAATYRVLLRDANGGVLNEVDPYVPGVAGEGIPGGNVLSTGPAVALPTTQVDTGTNLVIVDSYNEPGTAGAGAWQVGETDASFVDTIAAKKTANKRVARLPKDEPIRLSRFGARIGGMSEQTDLLNDIADIAANEGYYLQGDPYAIYRKDGPIQLNTGFDGQGCTFQSLSDGFQNIAVSGLNIRLANFRHLGGATTRGNGDNRLNGLTGENATNLTIENVEIGSPGVDSAGNPIGFAAAGMLFVNCDGVKLINPRVLYSLADAIHFTRNSKNADIYSPYVYRSGDDAIALAVSYLQDAGIVENIRLWGGTIVEPRARGVSVVGGRNCLAVGTHVFRSSAAAFYMASEAGAFNTHGVAGSRFKNAFAKDCVTGVGLDSNFSNAVILMAGQPGTAPMNGTNMSRSVVDSIITGRVEGTGARAPSAINSANPWVVRSHIRADVIDATGTAFQPSAVSIGGESGEVDISVQACGGPLLTMPSSGMATGKHRVRIRPSSGVNVQDNAINTSIYTEAAPQLQELLINGAIIDNAPTAPIIDVGGVSDRTRWNRFWLNGSLLPGKDYSTGTMAYLEGWSGGMLTRDVSGQVSLTGILTGGTTTAGTQIATLPVGYRPRTDQRVPVINADGSTGSLIIYATGQVGIIANVTASAGISAQFAGATA